LNENAGKINYIAHATPGMRDFANLNCVGSHATKAGDGMGPSLSDNQWIYGDKPSQIFLSIYQDRPNGMPAFGRRRVVRIGRI
jgi:cytochrome c oxidase cbb3-type subunit 3